MSSHTVDFTVPAHDAAHALTVARDALSGRGFAVGDVATGSLVAVRGNRLLTTLLGGLVRPRHHFFSFALETRTGGPGTAILRLRLHSPTAAIAGGEVGARRHRAAVRWAAGGIESALVAAGVLLHRE